MPDLDFSSPKKRSAKFKERLRGEAISGKPERKANFAFSFDFNEYVDYETEVLICSMIFHLRKISFTNVF